LRWQVCCSAAPCSGLTSPSQAAGSDPFTQAVNWFVGGPARGVAMLAIACVAVLAWVFTASLRVVGFVLGGGLVLANIDTIVGWMGF